nr:hypothetical protein Iba_chr07cCG5840 [Ipomoea batatas]
MHVNGRNSKGNNIGKRESSGKKWEEKTKNAPHNHRDCHGSAQPCRHATSKASVVSLSLAHGHRHRHSTSPLVAAGHYRDYKSRELATVRTPPHQRVPYQTAAPPSPVPDLNRQHLRSPPFAANVASKLRKYVDSRNTRSNKPPERDVVVGDVSFSPAKKTASPVILQQKLFKTKTIEDSKTSTKIVQDEKTISEVGDATQN